MEHLSKLKFKTALDAFSGTGCVAYSLKQAGVRVYANDFLAFCYRIAHATIENDSTLLTEGDLRHLLRRRSAAPTFVRDTYEGLFFNDEDCEFLDNLWANIQELESPYKTSLALAAASRACMKKRPRGLFTFTGKKGWDGRPDLKLSMREQFLLAVEAFNSAVFSNGHRNRTFNLDIFDLPPDIAELVYIDTPYVSPFSDCDYTRRYHFVEGYTRYWKGCQILQHTATKKIRSYETPFSTKAGAVQAFQRLFHHFRKSTLVVSYSSNGIPNRAGMIRLLKQEKAHVMVHEATHRYHHGTHAHRVGNNKNVVKEYLFIAS